MTFMINMIRNVKKEDKKQFYISNVTCYVKFRAPYLPSFDFRVLHITTYI